MGRQFSFLFSPLWSWTHVTSWVLGWQCAPTFLIHTLPKSHSIIELLLSRSPSPLSPVPSLCSLCLSSIPFSFPLSLPQSLLSFFTVCVYTHMCMHKRSKKATYLKPSPLAGLIFCLRNSVLSLSRKRTDVYSHQPDLCLQCVHMAPGSSFHDFLLLLWCLD